MRNFGMWLYEVICLSVINGEISTIIIISIQSCNQSCFNYIIRLMSSKLGLMSQIHAFILTKWLTKTKFANKSRTPDGFNPVSYPIRQQSQSRTTLNSTVVRHTTIYSQPNPYILSCSQYSHSDHKVPLIIT